MRTRQTTAIGDGLLIVPVRVLGFRVDGDVALEFLALGSGDVDYFLHADQRQLAIPLGGAILGVVQNCAGQPVVQLIHGEVADRPVVGMVFTIDHQGLEHGAWVGGIDLVAQVLGRAAIGGGGVFHIHQHTGRGALAGGHGGVGLGDVGHVGTVAQPGVMAGDQLAVPRHMHIQLQHVGTGIGRFFIRHAGLLWVEPGKTSVRNHLWGRTIQRAVFGCGVGGRGVVTAAAGSQSEGGNQRAAQSCRAVKFHEAAP